MTLSGTHLVKHLRIHSSEGIFLCVGKRVAIAIRIVMHNCGRANDGREAPIMTDEDCTGVDFLSVLLHLENHDEDDDGWVDERMGE